MGKPPELFLETVSWRSKDVEASAHKLVNYFARSLQDLGTKPWIRFAIEEMLNVTRQRTDQVVLHAEGFDLIFRWAKNHARPKIDGSIIVYTAMEPAFTLQDNSFLELMPSYRNRLYRVSSAIAQEMVDTYRMRVSYDPLTLTIPKSEYGSVQLHRAVQLG